ncbi:MAG: MATE family efflux transporter [Clostridiales bacterium]|jgi:putative MATE family efflux protein|nr:MATE family efflux transporter [Clostridiales bacterium]
MENQMNAPNKMGVMPVGRLLFSIALPLVVSMLIQACYNIVDSIFVARVSENALTAVSLAFPAQMLMISVAVGTGVGVNSLISRRLGEKRFEEANAGATNALFIMAVSALVFTLAGLCFARPFFRFFTGDAEIRAMGGDYLFICMTYCIGIFMQIACERIVQATGNAIYPMLMQLAGAVVNIILDPILIFGYMGFPALGVKGAAIATVAGQWVAMLLSFYLVFFKKHDVKPGFKNFRPDKRAIRDIYAVGAPSIVMQSIGTVMILGLNKILIAFTPTAVSVLGVYFKLNSFIFMPVFALSGAGISILGYNYGAKNRARMEKAFRLQLLVSAIAMLVGLLLFQLFPRQMLLLFNASDDMLLIGVNALRVICLSFPGAAVGISFSTLYQAVGKGAYSLLTSLVRQLFVILPAAYLLARFLGLDAVWWAFPIAEIAGLTMGFLLYRLIRKRLIIPLDART